MSDKAKPITGLDEFTFEEKQALGGYSCAQRGGFMLGSKIALGLGLASTAVLFSSSLKPEQAMGLSILSGVVAFMILPVIGSHIGAKKDARDTFGNMLGILQDPSQGDNHYRAADEAFYIAKANGGSSEILSQLAAIRRKLDPRQAAPATAPACAVSGSNLTLRDRSDLARRDSR